MQTRAAGGARRRHRGRRRRQRGRHAGGPSSAFPRASASAWSPAGLRRWGAVAGVALLLLASGRAVREVGPDSASTMLLTWLFAQVAVLAVWYRLPLRRPAGAARTPAPLHRVAAAVWLADAALAVTAVLC
ncbi:hypothetical protein [Actinomadura opuntiae]|uniref:hypothetical protein n=1 Tax=Actinomadura sp. OS1-43 TaxID=604315 RepID=UPI00255AAA63|nr:hypothetical protein [Actinomadura sp. OS1-43]MDL4815126.1 hypothetical protein [Actinomadura sp. OS1-43]